MTSTLPPLHRTDVATLLSSAPPGVDWITMWSPVRELVSAPTQWDRASASNTGELILDLNSWIPLSTGVQARASLRDRNFRPTVWLEFNPSSGGPLVDVEAATSMANEAWDEVENLVALSVPRRDINVSRMDLTVDAPNVANIQQMLTIAKGIHIPYRDTRFYGSTGRLETVNIGWGKTVGYVTVYDKQRAANLKLPALRVEARLRSGDLKRHGIAKLGDVTPDRCEAGFRQMVEPFRAAIEVTSSTALFDSPLPGRIKYEALGSLWGREQGIYLDCGEKRQADHRKWLAELGISHSSDVAALVAAP